MDVSNFYGYPQYRNCTINWLSMDNEERYNQNYKDKKTRLLLEKYNWDKTNIEYKFNNYGFRCENFQDIDNIVFLGCSHTVGLGIPINYSWTTLVGQELNLASYNLGISGGSLDTCFRLAYYWLEKLKPKIVILLETDINRVEYKAKNNWKDLHDYNWNRYGPWSMDGKDITSKHYKILLHNIENFEIQREKNILGIKELSKNIKTKLVIVKNKFWEELDLPRDLARDLSHPGILTNNAKAEEILKLI